MDLIQALTPNEQKLVFVSAVFVLYLIVILAFATVYYLHFIRVPSSFVFAANSPLKLVILCHEPSPRKVRLV